MASAAEIDIRDQRLQIMLRTAIGGELGEALQDETVPNLSQMPTAMSGSNAPDAV